MRREKKYKSGGGNKFFVRKRFCYFCTNHIDEIDYKDTSMLRHYLSERFKILPRRNSGNCAKHQRKLAATVKRARNMALLPFTIHSH